MTDHSALIERLEETDPLRIDFTADRREAAAALRDLTEWRDIAKLPDRPCMGVVAFFGPAHDSLSDCGNGRDERYEIAWFNAREWVEAGTAHSFIERGAEYLPTHWLPLPSAPNQAKEAGE